MELQRYLYPITRRYVGITTTIININNNNNKKFKIINIK